MEHKSVRVLKDLEHLLKSGNISLNTFALLDSILGILESLTELLDSRGYTSWTLLLEVLNCAKNVREETL
jgi:hypothetical protein